MSEAAGVNSAGGSFGLSFGLAFAGAIMLAALAISFNNLAQSSAVLTPAQQDQVAMALEEDAEIMSDTLLDRAAGRPASGGPGGDSRINDEARNRALQVALLVPLLASLLGLLNSFRMVRVPDPEPLSSAEGMVLG